ncbi:MAG: DEAD/DEAH box helicase [Burkholderiaceae bacterium]|nr:DEAD/DEAH box helicase [Burkholderiaceae bacterium]
MPDPAPDERPRGPRLRLQTLDRGDGLLGLRPCGPVRPRSRSPLFGARGPQVTVARLTDAGAADVARLHALGLQPLPAAALQWRGGVSPLPDEALYSLVREADFGEFCETALPALQAEGWTVELAPGFAHAAEPVAGWQIRLQPLTQPRGMGSWLLSLKIELATRHGPETLDLVPLLARLIGHDRRWTNAEALAAIPDDEPVRLHAPGGRRIDAPAAPLKAIVGAMIDLLTRPRRRADEPLAISSWDAQRLALLRAGLKDAIASHPSARRDWVLQGETAPEGLAAPPAAVEPPAGLGITLRPYQRDGLAWLQQLRRHGAAGILADDMGLGKTAQALAHLLVEQQAGRLDRPALVVAPASLIFNWQAESQRVAPALKLLTLQGPRRSAAFARIAQSDLVLTSYPLLWRDAMAFERQPWHLVVLDEAQMVKNAGSRTATTARRLNARHRLSLTGTPIENHLGELWAQFHFLLPGFLGDARSFQRDWRTPIEKNGETQRAKLLAQRVRPFILRRRKDQVAAELPPLTEQLHRVVLAGRQRALYESVRLAADERMRRLLAAQRFEGSMISVLDALLKLRQVCDDPRLLDDAPAAGPAGDSSAKLAWLAQTLPVLLAEGRRVLLFSQFTRMLALVAAELDALGLPWLRLTGDTPGAERGAVVARFQRGEAPLFLVSLKAGGVGLNLTAADTVIHLDPWWNPAVEQQASARAHRIGQHKPVLVYRLVAAGSIEERLLALQARKGALAEVVLGPAGASVDAGLQVADVQALLAPLDSADGESEVFA